MRSSLRLRLLAGSTLASGVILAVLSVATFLLMRRALVADFDSASLTKARSLALAVEQRGRSVSVETDQVTAEYTRADRPEYFRIRLDDGTEVARSPSLGGDGQLAEAPAGAEPQFRDAVLPDGRHGRVVTLRLTPRLEHDEDQEPSPASAAAAATAAAAPTQAAVLTVGRSTAEIDASLSHLKTLLVFLSGAAVAVSGGALLWVVSRALRPVNRLARDIEAFPENDLSRRLSGGDAPAELRAVVERFNGLLGRLQDAFLRERSFTADVAHELRTPIAGLHTTLQVGRSRRREAADYEALIDKCLKMTGGIGSVVQTLLLLARADAGQLTVENGPADLAELIDDCWESFRPRAADRGLRVEFAVDCPWKARTDAEKLAMILNNLFDNAVSYADEGGHVWIKTVRSGGSTDLLVSNTGSAVTPGDARHLFDRFWRGDRARADTGLHCGLGLSLCQRLSLLLGVRIAAECEEGRFQVTLSGFRSDDAVSDRHQRREAVEIR
jgi:two-component system sensor histidine kinase QseC